MDENNQNFYECPECHLKYKEKEWAEKCEAWCKEHKSCNLEIIQHAEKSEDDKQKPRRSHQASHENADEAYERQRVPVGSVLVSERTLDLPRAQRLGATQTTKKRASRISPPCHYFFISPFCRSEASQAKPKFPFNFLRLPPAPPAVFLKGKEIFGFARATGRSAPEARWSWHYRNIGA